MIENQQSPLYVVNWHCSRRLLRMLPKLSPLTQIYHDPVARTVLIKKRTSQNFTFIDSTILFTISIISIWNITVNKVSVSFFNLLRICFQEIDFFIYTSFLWTIRYYKTSKLIGNCLYNGIPSICYFYCQRRENSLFFVDIPVNIVRLNFQFFAPLTTLGRKQLEL